MLLLLILALAFCAPASYAQRIKENKTCVGISLFFLLQALSAGISHDTGAGVSILLDRVPLAIIPLSFCLIDMEDIVWNRLLLFYAIFTTLASAIGFFYGAWLAWHWHDAGYLYNDNITSFILDKQAVYFGLYVNIAVCCFIYLLPNDLVKKPLIYMCIAWLVFISIMLASKTSLACLLLILLFVVIKNFVARRDVLGAIILLFGLVLGSVLVIKLFPKTLNRFKGISDTHFVYENRNRENHFNAEYDPAKWNSTNTRAALWQCGVEIWKENFWTGTGLGDKKAALRKKYEEKKFWYALDTGKNLHNQFLDIAVSMGLIGLVAFFALFFFYPAMQYILKRQEFSLLVLLCIFIALCTENMLDRYQGEIILALFLPLSDKIKGRLTVVPRSGTSR